MFAQLLEMQNIGESNGVPIALTGMLIVFSALAMVTGFIAVLPKLLEAVSDYLPEPHHHGPAVPRVEEADEALVAAIGFALHQRRKSKGSAD